MASPRNVRLDRAQDAIIRATRRLLGERIAKYAAAYIERYGGAFNLRDFLQTARTPMKVALPNVAASAVAVANRQQIVTANVFNNARWVHVNEKDRYRIVLMTGFTLDAVAAEIPQATIQQINDLAALLVTRRNRIQLESFARYQLGHAPARQGSVAAGPVAAFSAIDDRTLDEKLIPLGVEEALKNPFDTLQPNEQFEMGFSNLTGAAVAANVTGGAVFATLQGVAIDIVTG
jgi:hypothetical protein